MIVLLYSSKTSKSQLDVRSLYSLITSLFFIVTITVSAMVYAEPNSWFFKIKHDQIKGDAAVAGIYKSEKMPPQGIFVLCRYGEFMLSVSNSELTTDLFTPVRYKIDSKWSDKELWKINHNYGNRILLAKRPEALSKKLMSGERVTIELEGDHWDKTYLHFPLYGAKDKINKVIDFCEKYDK